MLVRWHLAPVISRSISHSGDPCHYQINNTLLPGALSACDGMRFTEPIVYNMHCVVYTI